MTLAQSLERLASPDEYPRTGNPEFRWGQLLRNDPVLSDTTAKLRVDNSMCALRDVGTVRGGIVTRANAYFLVRELSFSQIPARMHVTKGDLARIAVVADGLDKAFKIEREYLKPVIKGPESLESCFHVKESELRLFDVKVSKDELKRRHANGALLYLKRGETWDYKTSGDDLKGGIPAQRSQVKNRKPFWYSLQGEQSPRTRIVFPEHIDKRYVFTLVGAEDESVVIDKLFLFEPHDDDNAQFIHAGLNSLFSWYQVELRGRSQLGEGVLELKIPDFGGILIANPEALSAKSKELVLRLFKRLTAPGSRPSFEELGSPERLEFDLAYLRLCGIADPESLLSRLELDLRALAGERIERKLSVADAKLSRRKITNVAASIDAYATKIAAALEVYPDPRRFVEPGEVVEFVPIIGPVDGTIEVGAELFNHGEVFAGGACIARAGSNFAAQFVRGVLLHQPDLQGVDVPKGKALESAIKDWTHEGRSWHRKFEAAVKRMLVGIDDARVRLAIEQRALKLLHVT